jgi:hypothetical protein
MTFDETKFGFLLASDDDYLDEIIDNPLLDEEDEVELLDLDDEEEVALDTLEDAEEEDRIGEITDALLVAIDAYLDYFPLEDLYDLIDENFS